MRQKREKCLDKSLDEQESIKKIKLVVSPLNPINFYPGFPHIAEKIFQKLDNNTLQTSREVAKIWQSSIDNTDVLRNKIFKRERSDEFFRLSCINGHSKTTELLLKNYQKLKIDLNATCGISGNYIRFGKTAFQWACWNGHLKIGMLNFYFNFTTRRQLKYG